MITSSSTLPTLQIEGRVATICLERPEQANRLSADDLGVLLEHIDKVNGQHNVLVLRIMARGKYFCSGYDLRSIGQARSVSFEDVTNALEDARPVTIAALQGGVYGGGTDLSLACDFRIGTPVVNMFMPAARLGLHFYQRGMERYVSRLGLNAAKRLFLTAEKIDAAAMQDCGFLTHLVAPEELEATVEALTATLSSMAPIALLGMKKHLNGIARNALDVQALRRDIERAATSRDLKEGGLAWAEKRSPVFVGE